MAEEEHERIGQYRVLEQLGGGGMGEVVLAHDETLDRTVALKSIRDELRQSTEAQARFLREARVLSQLDHPGICTIHDYLRTDSGDYLVLEHIEGQNLRDAIEEGLGTKARDRIATELVDVLVAAHGRGIVHRDLKPENIMLTPSGDVDAAVGADGWLTAGPIEVDLAFPAYRVLLYNGSDKSLSANLFAYLRNS